MPLKSLKKRYVSLLEVLIAFMIVAMCIFPLLYPHVAMFKDQAQFVNQIRLDHTINQIYADVYQKLEENQIPWGSIEQSQTFPVDLSKTTPSLPYKGHYQFKIDSTKPSGPSPISFNKIMLNFYFWDANASNETPPKYQVSYKIFIARNQGGSSGVQQGGGNAPTKP